MQERIYKLKKQMMLEDDVDGVVLIDGHTGSMCACNSSAKAMLVLLKNNASQTQLTSGLKHEFEIPNDQASKDVQAFLQSLSAMGAIETVISGGHSTTATSPQCMATLA